MKEYSWIYPLFLSYCMNELGIDKIELTQEDIMNLGSMYDDKQFRMSKKDKKFILCIEEANKEEQEG